MLLAAAIRGSNEHGFYSYSTPTVGKHIPRPKASTQTCLISIQTIQQMIPCRKSRQVFNTPKLLTHWTDITRAMSEVLKPKPAGLVQPVQSQERIMQKFKDPWHRFCIFFWHADQVFGVPRMSDRRSVLLQPAVAMICFDILWWWWSRGYNVDMCCCTVAHYAHTFSPIILDTLWLKKTC